MNVLATSQPESAAPRSTMSRRQWFRRTGAAAAAGLVLGPQVARAGEQASSAVRPTPSPDAPIRLSSNENPYGPSKSAREAMVQAFDEACRYPYAGAGEDLVKLIAEREQVTPDHVLLGCGSSEILTMASMAYGVDSGEVVAADPTYQLLMRYAENVGGYAHRVPLDEGMVHDLDAMERRITQAAKIIFICNPNNPTGTIVDPARLRDFSASVSSKAVVFVDEAYIDLLDDYRAHTMVDRVQAGDNVIVSRTLSKIHGLAGQRIGYGLARPDIIARLRQYRMGGPNVIGLRGAIASLQDEEFQTFSRAKMKEGREVVYALCDEMGYTYTPSSASFVFFHTGTPVREFQAAMLERGVMVGRPFPPYMDWCRISIGTTEEMQIFAEAVRDASLAMG